MILYKIVNISNNDLETLKWLYKMPYGKTQAEVLQSYSWQFSAKDVDELILKLSKNYFQRER